MNARKSLDRWIEESLSDQDKSAPCSALQLCYKRGYSDQEIHSTQIASGMNRTPKELADMFRGKAETHCQDMKGSQMFVLKAFYGTNEPGAMLPFRVNPPANDHDGFDAEEPTAEGGLTQVMRQNAQVFAEVMKQQRILNDQQNAFTAYVGEQLIKSQKENGAYQELVMKMMLDKIKLSHEERLKELEFQRSTEERRVLMQLGPPLLNKITGREVFPQNTVDTKIIETLAEKITPEQLGMLESLGVIPPEAMALVKSRFVEILEKRKKEQEETRQLLGFKNGAPELPGHDAKH